MYVTNLFRRWTHRLLAPDGYLRDRYRAFRELLEHDKGAHEWIAELERIHQDGLCLDPGGQPVLLAGGVRAGVASGSTGRWP